MISKAIPALALVAPDDAALVAQACGGDDRAFAALYKRHARYVAGVVYRLMGNDADLDDVMQEAFSDAAESLASLKDPAGLRSWLVRIAVRRCYKRLARRRRWHFFLGEAALTTPTSSDPRARHRVDALYEALGTLSPELRTPWVIHVIEGQTLPEAAKICDVSLATVKRRILEAETRLQRCLHET